MIIDHDTFAGVVLEAANGGNCFLDDARSAKMSVPNDSWPSRGANRAVTTAAHAKPTNIVRGLFDSSRHIGAREAFFDTS